MEITFITIHGKPQVATFALMENALVSPGRHRMHLLTTWPDLTTEARILYCSDSIVDVLGHTPDEVVNHSTWDFFHPSSVQDAQNFQTKSITMDRASVLTYCDIRNRQGEWVRCESCFSIVYNVMVACTSIYRNGAPSISELHPLRRHGELRPEHF